MSDPRPRLLVLAGPTGAGKSEVAIELAARLGGEIISADSVQVYRGLAIGSAKPGPAVLARAPHHCLDLFEPTEQSDAARWCAAADQAIAAVSARRLRVIVCGGTGLYLRALLHGLVQVPAIDPAVVRDVGLRMTELGPQRLHAELAELDPDSARWIASADRQRIARALSVAIGTGKPLSAWQGEHRFGGQRYPADLHLLWPDREVLYRRIDRRAQAMVGNGLVDEVRDLLKLGVAADAPALTTLGYRQVVRFIAGELADRDALVAAVAQAHRRYAKRQLTWFRRLQRETPGARHHADPAAALEAIMTTAGAG